MTNSLLPPNAMPLERALADATMRIGAVEHPLTSLWDPETCPIDALPWLAYAVGVDRSWRLEWSSAQKRAKVAGAIAELRRKGTRGALDALLQAYDSQARIVEWFEEAGRAAGLAPHEFEVRIPLVRADGEVGGVSSTGAFADAIYQEVEMAKPVRSHFAVVQQLDAEMVARASAAAQASSYRREEMTASYNADPVFLHMLQTEDGEPLQLADGSPIEENT